VGTGMWVKVQLHFHSGPAGSTNVSGTVRLYLQMNGNSPHPAYFDDFELTPRAAGPPPAVVTDKQ